ncbi:hypothetical protein ABT052_32205 [Streptomyces sp. NPDC002766]|uniref:NACHT domain-containing protein n=1 Tax=Streptomyces sp. NPDC002766 TaxID=3154429 RepID=UPI00332F64AF
MSGGDLIAAFCRSLKAKVDSSGVSRAELCRRAAKAPATVSTLLSGQRRRPPDWDLVKAVVVACGESEAYWRPRLEELVRDWELERQSELADDDPKSPPEQPGCSVCQDAYEEDRFQTYDDDWQLEDDWEPSLLNGAARVLGGANDSVRHEVQTLVEGALRKPEDLAPFRDQFRDIANQLLSGLGSRVRRACHRHRVRLLHAAHTLLVIEGGITGPILDLAFATAGAGNWQVDLGPLFEENVGDRAITSAPLPVANVPYVDHHGRVVDHYARVAEQVTGTVPPPEVATQTAAVYEARLAELAAECPELFVWAGMQDGPEAAGALRACPEGPARERLEALYRELHTQKTGLGGLETLLRALARDTTPGAWPARLSSIYRNELGRPISPIGEASESGQGPRIPRLAKGYVNPAFRTAVHGAGSRPHIDAWWNTRPLRQEIQGFLAGHLTGLPLVDRPLVILGDPGSGKSLLTRLLAARLPPTDYLPIRIELRSVPADAEIIDQINEALRQATQRVLTWDSVTESLDGVLPVLIFDGLDELLQAGGPSHWGYLQEIAEFQERSADNGVPVAAIVTSRTVVADQTRFRDGTVVIRLEPFDTPRIERWVDTWNRANGHMHRPLRRDLRVLHPDLAPQPLLLLMLALYHTVEKGPVLDDAQPMSRVALYERLMELFVRRQIRKLEPKLPPGELAERVEDELDLLSVIACAMFNRGRQGVSAEEADHDLGFLRALDRRASNPEARLIFGRFFFIHEAKAIYEDGSDQRWYEFLHATFGEYLVARKLARTLSHCPDRGAQDGLLFALLSFAPLTDRAQIIDNLGELLPATKPAELLFRRALHALPEGSDTGYTASPEITATYRHACYSANLMLVALAPGGIVHFSRLTADGDPAESWRAHATLWKSQFTAGSWDAFTRAVGTAPVALKDIALRLGQHDAGPTARNMTWLLHSELDALISDVSPSDTLRRSRALHDRDTELLLEPALPVFEELGGLPGLFVRDHLGRHVSGAHALIALLLCPREPHEELMHRYETCLKIFDLRSTQADMARLVDLISSRLAGESETLPIDFVFSTVRTLNQARTRVGGSAKGSRIPLLACVCRLLSRADREGLPQLLAELLGLDPQHHPVPRVGRTELMLNAIFQQLQTAVPGEARDRSLLWLLELAVALDLRSWCDRYGGWVLRELDSVGGDLLGPAEVEYLRASLSARDHQQQLWARSQERHP